MKLKSLLTTIFLITSANCIAQNSFPANGNVGIGTANPIDFLEVNAGSSRRGLSLISDGDNNAYSDIQFIVNNKSSIASDKPIIWVFSHRKDGYFSDNPNGQSSMEFYAVLNDGSYLAPLNFKSNGDVVLASSKNALSGNVGIGTTTPKEKLSVNGNIRAKEVKVEATGWPDYVFNKDYVLPTLAETEKHIKEKGHLPGMPSAKEVEANGVELGDMNKRLLQKIEELTLHLIAEKRASSQEIKKLNEKLIEQNRRLKSLERKSKY